MRDLSRLFDSLGRQMDRVFADLDTVFEEALEGNTSLTTLSSAYQITKTKDGVTILVGVPGCTLQDVQVSLAAGIITVTAVNPLARIAAHQGDGSMKRTYRFRVGLKVNTVDITAKVVNGLLTIEVKRQQQEDSPSGAVKVTG